MWTAKLGIGRKQEEKSRYNQQYQNDLQIQEHFGVLFEDHLIKPAV